MAFQFRCPNGCLLEAEDHDVGQIINCPACATKMAIPPNPAGNQLGLFPENGRDGVEVERVQNRLDDLPDTPRAGVVGAGGVSGGL